MSGIYLDYQATTPLAPQVAQVMQPYLGGNFGNPHSRDHAFGRRAAQAVEEARQSVAKSIGARPSEIIFTSGATESNNTAIKGVVRDGRRHVILSATEHACVLAAAKSIGGCSVLAVDNAGL
ncbi:MAG: aminotransferase class V-fold PLP-dependent enzyme, partial [Alphaproteobacteria bacterium]|nr:aminotransferase class V-fold PLP-dependent enzyme [Alphaproteobacteria bacterium]